MNTFIRHIVVPSIAPVAVIGLYFTPVGVFGCELRGLMALIVVLVSAVAALVTAGIGLRVRSQTGTVSPWWVGSTLILIVPLLLVLGPLG